MRRAPALALTLLAGCVSDRYVGAIGDTKVYGNRGYGLVMNLAYQGLDNRWKAIDPRHPEDAPPALRPAVLDVPIDLDGDGEVRMGETTHHLRPTLRLISKTSSAAKIDIDVVILGGKKAKARPLDDLLGEAVRHLSRTSTGSAVERFKVPPGFQARAIELPADPAQGLGSAYRLALIDQSDFQGEDGTRRQLVYVLLEAPALTYQLREDHQKAVAAILLGRQGGPLEDRERW